jgi:hypothetical protein
MSDRVTFLFQETPTPEQGQPLQKRFARMRRSSYLLPAYPPLAKVAFIALRSKTCIGV